MSKAKDQEQSPQPFALRRGIDGHPGWGGIRRRGDPGSIPVGKAYLGENVRFGDDVTDRPGLTKIVTTQPDGEAFGLKEYGLDVSRGAILINHSVAELSGYGVDWSPTIQDLDVSDMYAPTIDSDTATPRKSIGILNDVVYIVTTDGVDYYLCEFALPDKSENLDVLRKYSRVAKFPTTRIPHYLATANDQLWIGCYDGYVMRWDGTSLTDTTPTTKAVSAGNAVVVGFREKVYAFGTQTFSKYVKDGQWDTVPITLGTVFVPRVAASINDYLYVGGSDASSGLLAARWDGTTWVAKLNIGGSRTTDGVVDICEFNSKAVCALNRWLGDDFPPLGAFALNLEDVAEIATFGIPGGSGDIGEGLIGSLVVSGATLYASINEAAFASVDPTTHMRLVRMDNDSSVAGDWTSEASQTGWTLIHTWDAHDVAPEMVDVLPL